MSEQDRLAQATELVKAGNYTEAQQIVAEVIRANRGNARAWILMAKIVDDPQQALQCWEEVARLKPDDSRVRQAIAELKGKPISPALSSTQLSGFPLPQPTAPTKQKRQVPLRLLIGGGVAIAVVACFAGSVVTGLTMQSNLIFQPMSTAGTATAVMEQSRPSEILNPIPATAIVIVVTATNGASADQAIGCPTAEPSLDPLLPTAVGGGHTGQLPTVDPDMDVGTSTTSGALDTAEGSWGNYLRDMIAAENQILVIEISLLEHYANPGITQQNLDDIVKNLELVADRTKISLSDQDTIVPIEAEFDVQVAYANSDTETRTCRLMVEMARKDTIWYVLNPKPLDYSATCPK